MLLMSLQYLFTSICRLFLSDQTSGTRMQGVSLFAALLATVAITLNMSFPIGLDCPSNGYNGVWRYYNEGNSYLVKVPPCADNVNKTKIFEFYTYYTNPE